MLTDQPIPIMPVGERFSEFQVEEDVTPNKRIGVSGHLEWRATCQMAAVCGNEDTYEQKWKFGVSKTVSDRLESTIGSEFGVGAIANINAKLSAEHSVTVQWNVETEQTKTWRVRAECDKRTLRGSQVYQSWRVELTPTSFLMRIWDRVRGGSKPIAWVEALEAFNSDLQKEQYDCGCDNTPKPDPERALEAKIVFKPSEIIVSRGEAGVGSVRLDALLEPIPHLGMTVGKGQLSPDLRSQLNKLPSEAGRVLIQGLSPEFDLRFESDLGIGGRSNNVVQALRAGASMDGLMVGLERQISRTPPPKFKLPFSTWHIADWLLRGAGITDLSELHPTMVKDIVEQISQSRELGRLESDSLPQPDELLDTIFSLSERRVTSILSLGRR